MCTRSPQASKLSLVRALLLACVPLACAVGVSPELEEEASGNEGGAAAGGSLNAGGAAATTSAGKPGSGGMPAAFGGTANSGGKAGSGGGGSAGGAKGGGSGTGGALPNGGSGAGTAGSSAGGSGAGAGGSGAGCACPAPVVWLDDTSVSLKPGDCVEVAGAKYVYAGSKTQTWALKQCNPAKQELWCPDQGNDYKFTACP